MYIYIILFNNTFCLIYFHIINVYSLFESFLSHICKVEIMFRTILETKDSFEKR